MTYPRIAWSDLWPPPADLIVGNLSLGANYGVVANFNGYGSQAAAYIDSSVDAVNGGLRVLVKRSTLAALDSNRFTVRLVVAAESTTSATFNDTDNISVGPPVVAPRQLRIDIAPTATYGAMKGAIDGISDTPFTTAYYDDGAAATTFDEEIDQLFQAVGGTADKPVRIRVAVNNDAWFFQGTEAPTDNTKSVFLRGNYPLTTTLRPGNSVYLRGSGRVGSVEGWLPE